MSDDTTRELLIACDSELSAIAHGRPPSDKATLMDLAYRCRGIYESAPAPSDVKGEEPSVSDTNGGGKHIESDTKLTPLTDPSVRGVLVDDGEPRKLEPGEIGWNIVELYSHPHGWSVGPSLFKYQPLRVVPASEFAFAESSDLQAERDQLDVMCHEGAARCERQAERIKELETELAKRTQERDEAVPFMAALKGRHNGYDPGNSKMYPDGPPATPEVALNELIVEQEWLVNSELQQAHADAERLRKAIGEAAYTLATGGFAGAIAAQQMLLAALTQSPAAASGETDADSLYVEAMTDAIKRAISAPAAESEGNAQHHIEGAKILGGGSGSSAAESEGGELTEVERLEKCIEVYERSCTQWTEQCNGLVADNSALSARLAACEERCKELEAGIVEANRSLLAMPFRSAKENATLEKLGSLLAPKAGGEDAVV